MFKDNPFHKGLSGHLPTGSDCPCPVCNPPTVDPTNPKDLIGQTKAPLGLFPGVAKIEGSLALKNGADKYGAYNWRQTPVRISIYLDAIERHLLALRDGEDVADDSGVSHLGHIIAGAAIVLDAGACGTLIDDRPPAGGSAKRLKECIKTK